MPREVYYTGRWPGFTSGNFLTLYHVEVRSAFETMMAIDMCACLPLTVLIICCGLCVVRRSQVPIIYYMNLLASNVIQICVMIIWVIRVESTMSVLIYFSCAVASLYFRMCFALERCFSITCPLLDCMTQTKSSVLVCVLVWAYCVISVPLAIVLGEFERILISAVLPGPLFIFCLAWTFRALPAATSVPAEEKRRTLGALILLFFNYFLIIFPTIICLFLDGYLFRLQNHQVILILALFLSCPFVDLILFLFMKKGHIDKLLGRLCCCSVDAPVSDVAADHHCE